MPQSKDKPLTQRIREAISAKRDRPGHGGPVSPEREAKLLQDIERFDLGAAEKQARAEYVPHVATTNLEIDLQFPGIVPGGVARAAKSRAAPETPVPTALPKQATDGTGLLERLRQAATEAQGEALHQQTELTQKNALIDQVLFQTFHYLHDLVQQLNILKPAIPRVYPVADEASFSGLVWTDGFADYRRQAQSQGALVERVSFAFGLTGKRGLVFERDDLGMERLRSFLFDAGLQFETEEFRNTQRYVERARFKVAPKLSVSVRWVADFARGEIHLEVRNLERLGNARYTIAPEKLDFALLESFGRLVLGEASDFFERLR